MNMIVGITNWLRLRRRRAPRSVAGFATHEPFVTAAIERLVCEIGRDAASGLAVILALSMEMRAYRRPGNDPPELSVVAQRGWDQLAVIACNVRGNRRTLTERDMPQLTEAVVHWCALHLDVLPREVQKL